MPFIVGTKDRAPANRAEAARQRRSQHTQSRVNSAASRAVHPPKNRQVTMRQSGYGKPILQQIGTKRSRRQYYVTMDQYGAELRLPALPVINPGWRLLSGLLAILALAGMIALWNSPFFQIMSVEITGLKRISADELAGVLHLENLSIIELDPGAIKQEIAGEYPELMNVQVKLEMPSFVNISAEERQPVLSWRKGDQVVWVDTENVVIPARGEPGSLVAVVSENDLPRAPLTIAEIANQVEITQAHTEANPGVADKPGLLEQSASSAKENESKEIVLEKADPTLIAAIMNLSQRLPPGTEIAYQADHGLSWTDAQGWRIIIGRDIDQFDAKFELYQKIAGYLSEQGVTPVLVSVEQLNAPFYRLEQ